MSPTCRLLVFLIYFLSLRAASATPFTGQSTIWQSIEASCDHHRRQQQHRVWLFIENTTTDSAKAFKRPHLLPPCPALVYLVNVNQTTLGTLLTTQYRYTKHLKVVLNQWMAPPTEFTFKSLLISLQIPSERLIKWSHSAISTLQSDTRFILISQTDVAVHLNPILFRCSSLSGVFVPQSSADFAQLSVLPRQCNLQAAILNVSYNNVLPFCNVALDEAGRPVARFAIETEILAVLERRYNFSSQLIDAKGFGMLGEDGRWTGAIGQVARKTSHLGMCFISRSLARQAAVDFSFPVYVDDITFMSLSPSLRSRDWLLFRPFTSLIWFYIGLSLLAVAGILYVALKYSDYEGRQYRSLILLTIQLLALLIGQLNPHRWSHQSRPSIRLLYATWLAAALVLANSFSGLFYSILALPEFEPPLDTLEDLGRIARSASEESSSRLVTFADSLHLERFMSKAADNRSLFHQIGQHMIRTHSQMASHDEDVVRIIEKEPRAVFLGARIHLATIRRVYAHRLLHIGRGILDMDYLAYIFPKRSPLLAPFSRIIKQMHITDLIGKLLRRTFERLPWKPGGRLFHNPTTSVETVTSSLGLKDLRSVFLLWLFGIVVSALVLFSEMAYSLCKKQN